MVDLAVVGVHTLKTKFDGDCIAVNLESKAVDIAKEVREIKEKMKKVEAGFKTNETRSMKVSDTLGKISGNFNADDGALKQALFNQLSVNTTFLNSIKNSLTTWVQREMKVTASGSSATQLMASTTTPKPTADVVIKEVKKQLERGREATRDFILQSTELTNKFKAVEKFANDRAIVGKREAILLRVEAAILTGVLYGGGANLQQVVGSMRTFSNTLFIGESRRTKMTELATRLSKARPREDCLRVTDILRQLRGLFCSKGIMLIGKLLAETQADFVNVDMGTCFLSPMNEAGRQPSPREQQPGNRSPMFVDNDDEWAENALNERIEPAPRQTPPARQSASTSNQAQRQVSPRRRRQASPRRREESPPADSFDAALQAGQRRVKKARLQQTNREQSRQAASPREVDSRLSELANQPMSPGYAQDVETETLPLFEDLNKHHDPAVRSMSMYLNEHAGSSR